MNFFIMAVTIAGVIVTVAPQTRFNAKLHKDWEAYKDKHGKHYETDTEEHQRRAIWESNLNKIRQHNIRHSNGEVTYTLAMNKYGDMTSSELTSLTTGHKQSGKFCDCCESCRLQNSTSELLKVVNDDKDCTCCSDCKKSRPKFVSPLNLQIPTSVDWRKKSYVTDVKDQGKTCGGCWAFAALGSLEGQIARKSGKLIALSEQNLIDCSWSEGNHGCGGGQVDQAFEYIKKNGIDTQGAYNYTGQDSYCHSVSENKLAKGMGFVDIPSGDEKGVYNEPNCTNTETQLYHAVLVVGYGTHSVAGDYYIIKNSWGENWGLKGYMLISRNQNNHCGIATAASYPTV